MAILIYFGMACLLAASALGRPEAQVENEIDYYEPQQPIVEPPPQPETYASTLGCKTILLMQWVPNPIDKYLYIIVNISNGLPMEQGEQKLSKFTKEKYPDVGVIFTVIPGDADYMYTVLDVPVIGIDALKHDAVFMEYLDLIYTIHQFESHVELWAHFFEFQEAFCPVRERVSMAFQEYLEEYEQKGKNGGTDDFEGHQKPARPNKPALRRR